MSAIDESVAELEVRCNVPPGSFARPAARLTRGELAWVVISGKMAAGKDTIAPLVSLPGTGIEFIGYGNILRELLDSAMTLIGDSVMGGASRSDVIRSLAVYLGYSESAAAELLSAVEAELEQDPAVTPWSRTDGMRTILQKMGSAEAWLPSPDFLPLEAARRAMAAIDEGRSVIITGGRRLPDADIPVLAGAITVRLEVSRETQLRRLASRDGLAPSPELLASLEHVSETELDDYEFDVVVRSDEEYESSEADVAAEVTKGIRGILGRRAAGGEGA